MKPAQRLLSLIMKTFQNLFRQLLEFLRFGQEVILYALIFVSAFFRKRASLGCRVGLRLGIVCNPALWQLNLFS